jgi:hypothetical protein
MRLLLGVQECHDGMEDGGTDDVTIWGDFQSGVWRDIEVPSDPNPSSSSN